MKLLCVEYFLKIFLLKGEIMVVEQEDTELNILQQTHKKYIYVWNNSHWKITED